MELLQLVGRYFRLKRELAEAMREKPSNRARIQRLVADLSATRSEVFAKRSPDEQTGDSMSFLTSAFAFQSSQFDESQDLPKAV